MHLLQKAKAAKLSLVFASLLLSAITLSLLGGAGTVYAASVSPRSANIAPASAYTFAPTTSEKVAPLTVKGGGCTPNHGTLAACISLNTELQIVSDAVFYACPESVTISVYQGSGTLVRRVSENTNGGCPSSIPVGNFSAEQNSNYWVVATAVFYVYPNNSATSPTQWT